MQFYICSIDVYFTKSITHNSLGKQIHKAGRFPSDRRFLKFQFSWVYYTDAVMQCFFFLCFSFFFC